MLKQSNRQQRDSHSIQYLKNLGGISQRKCISKQFTFLPEVGILINEIV